MTPRLFLIGWAAWLGALALMLWIWTADMLARSLLAGAVIAVVLIAILALIGADDAAPRWISGSSVATVLVAVGVAVCLSGFTAGLWLNLIGAEIIAFGIAGLIREQLARRGARQR
jgi:hypothetical protein